MKKVSRLLTALVLAVVSLCGTALAQTAASGNIEGVVTDATGAVLPGVTVVVKNTATNISRDLVTDEAGRYRANALQPGVYEIAATLGGFQSTNVGNLEVLVGQTLAVDMKMRAAGVTETVTVTAESPLIDTRRTDVSNVVGETAIQNLPINGRRWENFVLLGPGVTNDGNFGLVSYRGISGLYNNNTVDGADNNQAFFSEARGRTRTSYSISQAAIKEFQVGVSNFSAEFGRAAGGTVNAVTKSGTNALHGEGFYFLRDDAFTSKDPFFPVGVDRPDERRQQFGVSAGGPIQTDKVFYFINYDQQVRNFPYFVRPSQSNFITGACTVPGCASTLAFYNGLSVFNPREGNNKIVLGKVDYAFSNKNTFTAQYNMHRWDSPNGVQTQPVISVSPSANGKDVVKTDFALFSMNSVVSDRFLNEARVQIGRDFEAQEPNSPNGPGTTVTGGIDVGIPNFLPRPKYPDERRYQFIDAVTWYKGAHSIKSGFDINYVQESLINLFQGAGIYAYPNINAIASDCPIGAVGCTPSITGVNDLRHYSSYNQQFDLRGAGFAGDVQFQTTDYNWFVQDNWRVSNQLTLNVGVRWEYQKFPQPTETETNGVKFTGNPLYPATVTFHQDKNNFGPRVGFTYDVMGAHTTVIRGGWGLYYGRSSNSVISSALTNNAVTFASYNFTPSSAGAPAYPSVFTAVPPTAVKPSIQYLSPSLERPQINMAELTVDRAVGADITVSASYLYSSGSHLPTFVDTNLNPANSQVEFVVDGQSKGVFPFYRGVRPDANLNQAIEVADIVDSTYNALVLQVNKRFNKGLLFNANYTLSKAEDTGQNSTTFISGFAAMVDPFNNDAEKGPASFDRRHRGVVSVHYAPDFLWGFELGGTGTFESGLPLNPTISINSGALTAAGPLSPQSVNGSGASNRAPWDTRNGFRQTDRKTVDMRVSKAFNLGGRKQLVALWEAFNIFNTINYTTFGTTKYNAVSSTYDATANKAVVNLASNTGFAVPTTASNTLFGPRDMQIGFRFLW